MIVLLKAIRNKLIQSGRVKRYFLYALGELILVVLGILFALQINNWNQQRQQNDKINKIKENVKKELIQNRQDLQSDLRLMKLTRGSILTLLDQFGREDVRDTTIDRMIGEVMGMAIWHASTFAMDEMVSSGSFSSVADQDLKQMIYTYKRSVLDINEHVVFLEKQSNELIDLAAEIGSVPNATAKYPFYPGPVSKLGHSTNRAVLQSVEFENRLSVKLISTVFVIDEYEKVDVLMASLIERL